MRENDGRWVKRLAAGLGVWLLLGGLGGGVACTKGAPDAGEASPAPLAVAASEGVAQEAPSKPMDGAFRGGDPALAPPPPDAKGKMGRAGEIAPPGALRADGLMGGGSGAPAAMEVAGNAVSPTPRSEVAIDPNGRFATTYRPGGGHLAAFESAVARGIVPAAEREIVGDVGARYAPAMDAPKGKAITLRHDLERGKVGPSGGPLHVRIALRSSADAVPRPHLSVHLVLDVSGSMAGESIRRAREAARALVDKLHDGDDFSLVTFSSDASVLITDGPVGARRKSMKETIAKIEEGGGTNIGRGLELGYTQALQKSIPDDAVRVVLLLSDGRANAGLTSIDRLSKLALDAFQAGIQTSSFGLGADYDGELMSAIAGDGAGGYYYLRDPDQITPALATELDKRLDPAATAVEVRVRLKPDVKLLQVYGSRRLSDAEATRVRAIEVAADTQAQKRDGIVKDRQDDAEGGMRFFIPAFARDDSHALLLKLDVPAGTGAHKLASIELKYKDRLTKKNVTDEVSLSVDHAASDAESAASADASVSRTVQGFAAGETLAQAAQRIARGDRSAAVALLSERESLLRAAAGALHEPLFLRDADRLARLREHAGASAGLGDPLVLAMLLETASRSHLH